MRLFVGVWLSENMQDAVMNYIDRSRREAWGWKWIKRQNLHFTLKFLGEIPAARLNELSAALKAIAAASYSFTLRLDKVGFFPKRGIPRVMWLGVGDGERELIQLAGLVEKNLSQGFGKSDKPFQPHLTIARAKREDIHAENALFPVEGLGTSCAFSLATFDIGMTMRVNGFSLIESDLYPSGAVYKTLVDFRFN